MRIDLEYLRKFVPLPTDAPQLREILARLGMETAAFETTSTGRRFFDLEIFPNRPDCLGHYGVARELAAKLDGAVFTPDDTSSIDLLENRSGFTLRIENPVDCRRYCGCIVRNVRIGESPQPVRELLEAFGLRPINNLVDISNIILYTTGHPLHFFDLARLQDRRIEIRRGRPGEKIVLLDERQIDLDERFLIIADGKRPVALAGIMGGLDSGVTDATVDLFIESAWFDPVVIRKAARFLGIQSDASYRFERGADIENTIPSMKLALKWIAADQGQLDISYFQDLYPGKSDSVSVKLDKDFPQIYSGMDLPASVCENVLLRLGFRLSDGGDHWLVSVPTHRVDVVIREDLVEEIIRHHGYDRLNSVVPRTAQSNVRSQRERDWMLGVKHHLTSCGCSEVINYVFQAPEENRLFSADDLPIELKNPLGKDFSVMKNSLLCGLLRNIAFNFDAGTSQILVFETGKTFFRRMEEPAEKNDLAIAASGLFTRKNWKTDEQPFDFFAFKSLVSSIFKRSHLDHAFRKGARTGYDPGCCFAIEVNGIPAGWLGQVGSEACEFYKLESAVFAAEIEVAALISQVGENRFKSWNRFPLSKRDFSFWIVRTIPYERLRSVIDELKPQTLESFELFDVYEGAGSPGERVSLSMSFSYRSPEKTLTSEEINAIHQDFVGRMISRLDLIQR